MSEHTLDVRNPKVIPAEDLPGFNTLGEATAFREKLRAEGYDGMVIDARHLGGPVNYVAFDHGQVGKAAAKPKSAKTEKPAAPAAKDLAVAATEASAEDPHVTATRDSLATNDVKMPTGGFDAEGNPEIRSGRELLAEADADVANAETMGQGIAAAVSCFLTRGA